MCDEPELHSANKKYGWTHHSARGPNFVGFGRLWFW
jgi:hypothetical protein